MYEFNILEGENRPLFFFTTDNGYTYNVSFNPHVYKIEGITDISQVDVICLDNENPKKDIKVGKTICAIIEHFLSQNKERIVGYICDTQDKREESRNRKFYNWYRIHNNGGYTLKNYEIRPNQTNEVYYTAVIYHPEAYLDQFIDDTYGREMKELEDK
ncbi:MAG: DUF6169 family protein [Flavobacteriaceae bacterium]